MLVPTLNELLELRYQAGNISFNTTRRTQAPLSGLYASVFRGQGMDFDEVREYQAGDEVRNIDWRVTARMGKPYLKVYREERERSVVLCVDTSPYMQFGTRHTFKFVQAAKIAALLGWSAQGHGDRISGMLFGQEKVKIFRPNRTKTAFSRFLRSLTELPTEQTVRPHALEQALLALTRSTATGALIFIIADFHHTPIDELRKSLDQLHQQHEVVLITIDDPADYELPDVGNICLTHEKRKLTINTDSLQGRIHYYQHWQNTRQQLKLLARRLIMDFFAISTQDNPYQSLVQSLRQRFQQQITHR